MTNPRWRKVLRDLWGNKVRTILVILSIAIGVFAIGMIVGTQVILSEELAENYAKTDPASAILFPNGFDEDLVFAIRRMDEVADAEGRRSVRFRVQVGPDEWKNMSMDVIADYDDIRLNKIKPVSGEWPPSRNAILIERASLPLVNAEVGEMVTVEDADGRLREMPIVGVVHDLNKEPAQFSGQPYVYATLDTLEWLGYSRNFDEMHILVEGDRTDKEHIQAVADKVEQKIEKSGRNVFWIWTPEPGEHPANAAIQPMLVILGALGALSLFASGFLVVNIINGLLTQQMQQIGIMKAVGARRGQVMQMYLAAVIILGLLSLIVAIPLGGLAAYGFSSYMAGLINFDLNGFRIPERALVIMIIVGIVVPLLAAFYPVVRGSRITVREAISEQGLGKGQFGANILDKIVNWVTSTALALSRPMRISLRNTIRRKARLLLTLFTLTLGGAIFIGILSVHASLLATLDDALAYFNYDVDLNFDQRHRIEEIRREALRVPGVVEADSWVGNTARRLRADGTEGPNLSVLGTVADTNLIQPTLLEGRWLLPDDTNAIVVNTEVTKEETDVKVGDTVTLQIDGREREWKVVGLVQGVMTGRIVYANRPFLARELRTVGRAGGIQIIAESSDAEFQADLARRLKTHFDSVGMRVSSTSTTAQTRENIEFQFNIIVTFLAVMALLIAVVGGLGLMGTMSINVMERTREIGVMRAVGASDFSVLRIVLVEGVFVGILSWLVGALSAYPIGRLLSDAVGVAFLESPLTYVFSTNGAIGWLIAILIIAALASFLPARSASKLSVRQTLAYE